MGARASESMWRAQVSTSACVRTMNGRFLTPGLRKMSCSELSVCFSTCSGQMSTCTQHTSMPQQRPNDAPAAGHACYICKGRSKQFSPLQLHM